MSGFEVISAITGIVQLVDSSLQLGKTVLECHDSWHVTHDTAQEPRECLGGSTWLNVLPVLKEGAP